MKSTMYLAIIAFLFLCCSEMEVKWTKEIDAAGPGHYRINDISPIRKKGVCITGSYWTTDSGRQCFTARCDSMGEFEWFKIFDFHNYKSVEGKSIIVLQGEVDILQISAGVYVHAQAIDSLDIRRLMLIRYDSFGNIVWEKIVDIPADQTELESTILSDYSGDIYIAGLRMKMDGKYSIFITKYDQSGEELWNTDYSLTSLHLPHVRFDVKRSDQIIVGGVLETYNDFFFIRCDSTGKFRDLKIHQTPEKESILMGLEIGITGTVYITGISYTEETGKDYLTVVYNENDSLLWLRRFDGPAHMDDIPKAIAAVVFDDSFHVYVTGLSQNSNAIADLVTIKYDQTGNEFWVKKFVGKIGESVEPFCLNLGSVYHAGQPITPSNFYIAGNIGSDALVLRYNSNGFLSWFTRYGDKGEISKATASAKGYVAVESTSERKHKASIVKYGETEQFGIIRWD